MDYEFKNLEDGRSAGRVMTEIVDFPYIDEDEKYAEGEMTHVYRAIVEADASKPGSWKSYVERAEIDGRIEPDQVDAIPADEWSPQARSMAEHSDPREARIAASQALRDEATELERLQWGDDSHYFGSPALHHAIANNPVMTLGGFAFDVDKGGDVSDVTASDRNGFFYDGYIRDEGAPHADDEGIRRSVLPSLTKDEQTFDDWETKPEDIPYETGRARPSLTALTKRLDRCEGNIVRHAANEGIGLTDALRDALMTDKMSIAEPLAYEVLRARTGAEYGAATRSGIYVGDDYQVSRDITPEESLRTGVEALSSALKKARDEEGLSVRDELITLKGISRISADAPAQAHVNAAATLFGMIGEAKRFGVEAAQFIRPIARYAVAAMKDVPERLVERPKDSRREMEDAR